MFFSIARLGSRLTSPWQDLPCFVAFLFSFSDGLFLFWRVAMLEVGTFVYTSVARGFEHLRTGFVLFTAIATLVCLHTFVSFS